MTVVEAHSVSNHAIFFFEITNVWKRTYMIIRKCPRQGFQHINTVNVYAEPELKIEFFRLTGLYSEFITKETKE